MGEKEVVLILNSVNISSELNPNILILLVATCSLSHIDSYKSTRSESPAFGCSPAMMNGRSSS